ncbi:hypothetical protein QO179_23955 [Bacillus stercoris]|nr:hypothetical protein [Bacillus stercoris]
MVETNSLKKYEIIPYRKQFNAIISFFKKFSDENGVVTFTHQQMFSDSIIKNEFSSLSYMSATLAYLSNEGYIKDLQVGSRHLPSICDVSKLLSEAKNIKTREELGYRKPKREWTEESSDDKVEIQVVKKVKEDTNHDTNQEQLSSNEEVLAEISNTVKDMTDYLKSLPSEFASTLNDLTGKLNLVDSNAISRLQDVIEGLNKEKMDLQEEVQKVNAKLEEANQQGNYNKDDIYRQRNLMLDEIDRISTASSWELRKMQPHFRTYFIQKLNAIMEAIGLDTSE